MNNLTYVAAHGPSSTCLGSGKARGLAPANSFNVDDWTGLPQSEVGGTKRSDPYIEWQDGPDKDLSRSLTTEKTVLG